jgi:hypothetical protein
VEVAKVPLPQLSPRQWEMLRQQQGGDSKPLRLYIVLSINHGQAYGVNVLRGTGYADIDSTIDLPVIRTPGPDDNQAKTTSVPTSNFLFEIFATLSYKRSVVDDAVRRVH